MSNTWTTPTHGLPGRDRWAALVLEADFKRHTTFNIYDLQPWRIAEQLLAILGNHKLHITTHAEERMLVHLKPQWKRSRYSSDLSTDLASLGDELLWSSIKPALDDTWNIHVLRGTGDQRHLAWWLEFDPFDRRISLGISLAHLPTCVEHTRTPLTVQPQDLVDAFFACAAKCEPVECARASLNRVIRPSVGWHPSLFVPADGDAAFWSRAEWSRRSDRKPWIPYIARANLFSAEQVRALGGRARLDALNADLVTDPQDSRKPFILTDLPRGCLAVQFQPINHDTLRYACDASISDAVGPRLLLAGIASRAGILHLQDEHILAQQINDRRLYRQQATASIAAQLSTTDHSPFIEMSRADLRAYMNHMWSNPPRCVQTSAVVAVPDPNDPLAHTFHEGVTRYHIRDPREHHRALGETTKKPGSVFSALPIYGLRTPDEPLLASPIRIGSTNPDRAIFSFDSDVDGYDAELAAMDRKLPREAKPRRLKQLVCPDCQGRLFHARGAFEYPLDEELKDDPACWSHREDFFTWFWLEAQCATCPWRALVADIECA